MNNLSENSEPASLRTTFVLYDHRLTPAVRQRLERFRAEIGGRHDLHVIGYFDDPSQAPAPFGTCPQYHAYGPEDFRVFDYPRKLAGPFRVVPGNGDMPVMRFMRDHPEYERVWLFEGDVAFTGDLRVLLDTFESSNSDLVATNVRRMSPLWYFAQSGAAPRAWPVPDEGHHLCFLPVFRASRRFLDAVDRFYRDGGGGHYEWVWAYVALASKLGLEDIGGNGPFVRPENRNRFYTSTPAHGTLYPGTFRYRPVLSREGRRKNTLWHPVKDAPVPLRDAMVDRLRFLKRLLRHPPERR